MKVTANDLEMVSCVLSDLRDRIGLPIDCTKETSEAIWFAPDVQAFYFTMFIHSLGPSDFDLENMTIHIDN